MLGNQEQKQPNYEWPQDENAIILARNYEEPHNKRDILEAKAIQLGSFIKKPVVKSFTESEGPGNIGSLFKEDVFIKDFES